jgi:ketosteroid isomerase-like protein
MPTTMPSPSSPLERVIDFYERLAPADTARVMVIYAPTATFKDPFNEVRGTAAIQGIFDHMFQTLREPRFTISSRIAQGDEAFLVWDMHFRFASDPASTQRRIHGGTHLRFNNLGQVTWHRDYWDAAEELYEQLPVLGSLMRWVKRRVNQS